MIVRASRRRGVTLIMSITAIAFLIIVFAVLFKLAGEENRQARHEENRVRSRWLAESGLERAWARLRESPSYRGETWEIAPETLQGRDSAIVQIQVDEVNGRTRVTSRADFPRTGISRARQTRIEFFTKAQGAKP